ncbi:efflux transporter outer membrane subunit [Cupriavidus sp. P-10]|uniref:efflux transporter outer membrane subunit n=2 Tax=Cupriavidus TaxID=106589 RepID=UPI000E2E82E4|nr:efflux transporter outer membrane subunit [Cupriavidus sp. TA19]BDB28358.1 efflux transporter outer membrane subunit [Cupriavidus sp. P-10]
MVTKVAGLLAALMLAGCVSMAPQYERPDAPVASGWRDTGAASSPAGADARAVAEIDWREVFQDERLQRVIALSLQQNRDLRVAMLNIDKARAQYRIQRAELFPAVSAGGGYSASRATASVSGTGTAAVSRQVSADVGMTSWELDLFGRIRSLKDEALENWLAIDETQRSTRLALVAEVATDWLTLAADRQRLALAQQTLASQQETLKLTEYQHAQGIASGLDLAQVQTSVESARVDVATYQAQVAQDRNALELVVGAAVPDAMLPGDTLDTPVALAPVPAGLDSTVLLQRPDVLSAEHSLKAANADIGAARAAFFPTVTLTAAAGQSSTQLAGLFSGVNYAWSFAPSISVPIFNAGSLRASLDAAKIQREITVAQYEKAIQTAFREVADALAVRATVQQRLAAQQALVDATSRSYKLADARYRSGADSYLNALDAQRSLYSAQQNLITLQLTERSNRVALFKVLGGGADAGA